MKAVECLKNDGIVAYPTDTVYGLCCRYDHKETLEKLKNVKHRPMDKSLPIMVSDIEQMKQVGIVDEKVLKLANAFMPGPVTFILKKSENIESWMNDGKDTVAVRMATDNTIKQIIESLGLPIYMTSANFSNEPACVTYEEVLNSGLAVDMIVEGTPLKGQASTIIDVTSGKVLRHGPITQEQIDEVLK